MRFKCRWLLFTVSTPGDQLVPARKRLSASEVAAAINESIRLNFGPVGEGTATAKLKGTCLLALPNQKLYTFPSRLIPEY